MTMLSLRLSCVAKKIKICSEARKIPRRRRAACRRDGRARLCFLLPVPDLWVGCIEVFEDGAYFADGNKEVAGADADAGGREGADEQAFFADEMEE